MGILNPNWKPDDSMRPPQGRDFGIPAGWKRIGTAYSDGDGVVVCGTPEPEADEDNPKHNCDEMGCGSVGDHVVERFRKSELTRLRDDVTTLRGALEALAGAHENEWGCSCNFNESGNVDLCTLCKAREALEKTKGTK